MQERLVEALKPGNGLPEIPATKRYERLIDMPADVLAHRVVGSLIRCKGNLNDYSRVIEALIVDMRAEFHSEVRKP